MKILVLSAMLLAFVGGCTSILGDFKVEKVQDIITTDVPCQTDEECDKGFYPGSVCIEETGRCKAYLDGGVEEASDQ